MEYRSLEHKIRDLWINEANRNTEIRKKVANVGRPDDNVKDETSKLAKQTEIQRKIIEAADDNPGNTVSDKKKPKDTEMDDMDAKTIKGGKTEVDTEPKTDDSTENSTDEDKKSKKAANQENKKIGAKGVKEETMLRSDKNHGSSQSLIDAVMEALKGNQHKIDANHNNKIDAEDFKLLKAKKKMEEAAKPDYLDMDKDGNKKEPMKKAIKDQKMKEEVEAIDEVSSKTMASYITKASAATTDKTLPDNKVRNRYAGVALADKKMEKMRKEEVELSATELARIEEIAKGL